MRARAWVSPRSAVNSAPGSCPSTRKEHPPVRMALCDVRQYLRNHILTEGHKSCEATANITIHGNDDEPTGEADL